MHSATRTALYLAISAIAFGANEASAALTCKYSSGVKVCWGTGSQFCEVTVDTKFNGEGDPLPPTTNPAQVQVSCSITGVDPLSIIPPPNGIDGGEACASGDLPAGTLVCAPPPPLAPTFTTTSFKGSSAAASTNGNSLKKGGARHDCKHVDANGHRDPECYVSPPNFVPPGGIVLGNIISTEATNEKCNGNGICKASAVVLPSQTDGNALCAIATEDPQSVFVDFTASQFIGIVEINVGGGNPWSGTVYQLCTLVGNAYDCFYFDDDPFGGSCGYED